MKIKRAYAPVEDTDGYRILVDRLWPEVSVRIRRKSTSG